MITFSGVEGAGKSTQARWTAQWLSEHGVPAEAQAFVELGFSTRVLRGLRRLRSRPAPHRRMAGPGPAAPGSGGSPGSPAALRRRMTCLVDILLFRLALQRAARRGVQAWVCDRYFYDALSRLTLREGLWMAWVRRIMPVPDLAFLLEVDPEIGARRRRTAEAGYHAARARSFEQLGSLAPSWQRVRSEDPLATRQCLEGHLEKLVER